MNDFPIPSGDPMVAVDTRRLFEDLRGLLHEPFRSAFLRRKNRGKHSGRKYSDMPSATIEAVASSLLFDRPRMRGRISKIVDEHMMDDVHRRSRAHNVYTPEVLKEMILDIGREAWEHRYNGRLEVELKVRQAEVSLHWMRHPGSTAAARLA